MIKIQQIHITLWMYQIAHQLNKKKPIFNMNKAVIHL